VLIVDADAGTPAQVERVPIAAGRPLRTLRGTLAELSKQATEANDAYLRVMVDEPARTGLADEVRELFPNAVEVSITAVAPDDEETERWSIESMRTSPADLFAEYLGGKKIDDPALIDLFRTLMEEAVAPDPSRD
jgi:exonuclease SbcD